MATAAFTTTRAAQHAVVADDGDVPLTPTLTMSGLGSLSAASRPQPATRPARQSSAATSASSSSQRPAATTATNQSQQRRPSGTCTMPFLKWRKG